MLVITVVFRYIMYIESVFQPLVNHPDTALNSPVERLERKSDVTKWLSWQVGTITGYYRRFYCGCRYACAGIGCLPLSYLLRSIDL